VERMFRVVPSGSFNVSAADLRAGVSLESVQILRLAILVILGWAVLALLSSTAGTLTEE